ncbi:phospholipid-binding protein MlaC [Chitinimonas sp.]|uniref:MlaC/ttg2D family ABC transporter substrate-binding protein n=1 Tax=Chitinimonas sp. TaxID=1934313 RepID=UPI0035B14616
MRKLFTALLFVLGLSAIAAEVPVPESLVRNTSKDVLDVIKKENLTATDKRFREVVEQKALPNFDFTRITALAVGRYWKEATPEQQAALTREFKTLLIRTYSTALSANKIQAIDVKPVKMADSDADVTVKTEVQVTGGQPFPIDYRLYKANGAWKVYDVTVEGVSLVTNYRTSFNQTIQKGGIDGLVKALVDRNAALPTKTPA